jgi:UDP-glucose 4-epimerase
MDSKILITGATGFIGRSLVRELIAKGYSGITALARKNSDTGFLKENGIALVYGDLSDKQSLMSLTGKWDVIFHCAGLVGNYGLGRLRRANLEGTKNICRLAFERKAAKFIYLSSVAVNSGNPEVPLVEKLPYKPTNNYGISKMEAEIVVREYLKNGLPAVILRPCMVYGEGEPHLTRFLSGLLRLRLPLPYLPDKRWHLLSVSNLAACLVRCMEDPRALRGIFNVADDEILTVRDILGVFAGSWGAGVPLRLKIPAGFLSSVPFAGRWLSFFCKDRVYSISRLKETLDFIPPYQVIPELTRAAVSCRGKK